MNPNIHQAAFDIDMEHFHKAGLFALRQHRPDGRSPRIGDLHKHPSPPANVCYSSDDYIRHQFGQRWRNRMDRREERLKLENIAFGNEFKRGILRGGQRH